MPIFINIHYLVLLVDFANFSHSPHLAGFIDFPLEWGKIEFTRSLFCAYLQK